MASKARKKQLLEANEEEEKRIKRLERLLKLKRKKSKLLSFADDGLDYLLEVVDKKDDEAVKSCDSDTEDLCSVAKRPKRIKKQKTVKQETTEFSSDDCISDNEEVEAEANSKPTDRQKPKIWEDIYGRLRDEHGNVIKNDSVASKSVTQNKNQENLVIKSKLKGLLNRLSESNMQSICREIEDLYMRNSRNEMNETLIALISEQVISNVLSPPRLIMNQVMLVAALHANIGPEIGAFVLHNFSMKLDTHFNSDYGEGKECDNILIFLSHLYNFKVTTSRIIFDIIHRLIETFRDKDIELLHLLFKNIGFNLRKDNPLLLKEVILSIQTKISSYQCEDSRMKFMLETLTAIRSNNIYRITDYDPSMIEHAKKILRNMIRKGSTVQELSVSLQDLLNADKEGKWWIVEASQCNKESDIISHKPLVIPGSNDKVLKLAQKQHMNTEIRKSIFCIIMTAEDYMDAYEKLIKLGLRNIQEREIVNVILHCVLQEKTYNPYYAFLAGKFCRHARKYFVSLQFSLWDKFKVLSSLKKYEVNNLAHLLTHLFISGSIPISVLKVIQFSEMDTTIVHFLRKILLPILLEESEEACCQVFKRIALAKNLGLFREGLRLFMHHFLLRNQGKSYPENTEKLRKRVKLVEGALNSSKNEFKL